MKNFFLIALCLSASAAWTQSAAPANTSVAQSAKFNPALQQQLDNLHQYIQAYTQKDVAYFKRTLTDDFLYVPRNGGASDRAEFLEDISSPDKEKPPRVYNVKVIPLNDTAALLTYDEVDTGDQPRYRRISQVWIKPADQWKLKFMQTTPNIWSLADTD